MARPRKKTAEIERAQGYPGRRRGKTKAEIAVLERDAAAAAANTEIKAPPVRVPPPPELLDDEGRRLWAALGGDLVRRHIIKSVGEWQEFGRYCDHCSTWRKLRDETRTPTGRLKTTYTTFTAAGGKRRLPNPAFAQMLQLENKLKDYEDRFGLNPQSRTTLLTRIASTGGDKPPRSSADDGAATPDSAKPGSPLGILNQGKRLN